MSDLNDLSDKAIMAGTKVEGQPSSGRIRFVTKLPSGKPLESEWVQESSKTAGVLRWCEAVRQAVAADYEETRRERVAAARAARALRESPPSLVASDGSPLDSGSAPIAALPSNMTSPYSLAGIGSSTPAAPRLVLDPFAFLEQSLKAAEKAAMAARVNLAHAQAQSEAAEASYKRWKQAYDAIHTAHKIEAVPSPE